MIDPAALPAPAVGPPEADLAPEAIPAPPATTLAVAPAPIELLPAREDNDARLVALWLHGRSKATQRAYAADLAALRALIPAPLRQVSLDDLQAYQDSLLALATTTQARRLSAIKSLLSFGQRTGFLSVNVGAAVRLPKAKQTLSERILDVDAVLHLVALERHARNKALLRLLYLGGLRISEVCALRGRDLAARDDAGQVTLFGKGGKTRAVLLKVSIWQELIALRAEDPDAPVFRSRQGGALDPSQVHRIVKAAAKRARLPETVSAHWLRHAHVSHALDRGAPVHLVQATVGHASLTTTSRYAHARPNDSSSRYLPG
ncbi:MAG TPA: tyrosine-type recombinase/integrase [Acetobacteraceae bacterium]